MTTLGEVPVVELLASAQRELAGLTEHLKLDEAKAEGRERVDGEGLVVGGYVGSIMARIANAQMKLTG